MVMMNDYDEIRFIRHRYKVTTLLVSVCKINNNKPKQNNHKNEKKRNKVEIIRTKYKR